MKDQAIDITGQRFSWLVVDSRLENNAKGQAVWKCVCGCGNVKAVTGGDLRAGNVKSCGCRDKIRKHNLFRSRGFYVHD
jgi:hypothetical protein